LIIISVVYGYITRIESEFKTEIEYDQSKQSSLNLILVFFLL